MGKIAHGEIMVFNWSKISIEIPNSPTFTLRMNHRNPSSSTYNRKPTENWINVLECARIMQKFYQLQLSRSFLALCVESRSSGADDGTVIGAMKLNLNFFSLNDDTHILSQRRVLKKLVLWLYFMTHFNEVIWN